MATEKHHIRCRKCGFIRYNTSHMNTCPNCNCKDQKQFVQSLRYRQETIELICEALDISPLAPRASKIKEAVDILMNNRS